MAGRLTVVSYDVPDDRRRLRLANALKDFGVRVQYSVFECHLDDSELPRLRDRLEKLIKAKEDRVRLYRFCLSCESRQETYGPDGPTEDPEVYIL